MEKIKKEIIFKEDETIDLKMVYLTLFRYKYKLLIFNLLVLISSLIYTLSIPNIYSSSIVLAPQSDSKKKPGSLSSLLTGVNFGSYENKDPYTIMLTKLDDYSFNKIVLEKYKLIDKLDEKKNLVFAFGIDAIYDFLYKNNDKKTINSDKYHVGIKKFKNIISISKSKQTGLITLTAKTNDRFLAKKIVDIYLVELVEKIKSQDMKQIEKQIKYYNKELKDTYDVSLKEELSKSLSNLYQKKVFSQANDYYLVSKVVDSRVVHINEKIGPKRTLILLLSFLTSIVISFLTVLIFNYLFNKRKNEI